MNKKLRERVLSVLKKVEYSGWDYGGECNDRR